MIIALCTVIVSRMVYIGVANTAFDHTIVEREQAKVLAMSGIQCALSMLDTPTEPPRSPKKWLERIIPSINRWQTITFKEDSDGFDGRIKFCISCEDGKLNLNQLYDFKKHSWISLENKNIEPIVKQLCERIEKKTHTRELFKELNDFLSKREYLLEDNTELLTKNERGNFKLLEWGKTFEKTIFYEPLQNNNTQKDKSAGAYPLYLNDIFTVWTDTPSIEPWFFSDSICALLDLPRATIGSIEEREQLINQWVNQFSMKRTWPDSWSQQLSKLYNQENNNALPSFLPTILFSNAFNPRVFSVISYGTAGQITQKVCAILERLSGSSGTFVIKRVYWIS
jgi:hypothetical protein